MWSVNLSAIDLYVLLQYKELLPLPPLGQAPDRVPRVPGTHRENSRPWETLPGRKAPPSDPSQALVQAHLLTRHADCYSVLLWLDGQFSMQLQQLLVFNSPESCHSLLGFVLSTHDIEQTTLVALLVTSIIKWIMWGLSGVSGHHHTAHSTLKALTMEQISNISAKILLVLAGGWFQVSNIRDDYLN